ncbi:MAG: hypothetical protein II266_03345, partial [Clostridia bacterium]|nr:hypothetical protein [Clostridia bacterium]
MLHVDFDILSVGWQLGVELHQLVGIHLHCECRLLVFRQVAFQHIDLVGGLVYFLLVFIPLFAVGGLTLLLLQVLQLARKSW